MFRSEVYDFLMDLRRLTYFLAVVDHGGFTNAAKALFVSQPALSLAVRQLEEEVGTELLYRLGRGVRLTPAGEAFVGPARQALRDLEIARASAASIAGLETGTLALGSLPTLAADPLADLVGRFRAAHPGVLVDLAAPEDTADLVALLRDGALRDRARRAGVAARDARRPTSSGVSVSSSSFRRARARPRRVSAGGGAGDGALHRRLPRGPRAAGCSTRPSRPWGSTPERRGGRRAA